MQHIDMAVSGLSCGKALHGWHWVYHSLLVGLNALREQSSHLVGPSFQSGSEAFLGLEKWSSAESWD